MNKKLLLEHGINVDANAVKLIGDVDADMLETVILAYETLASGFKVLLSSEGGDPMIGFAIYDILVPCNVHTIAIGEVSSSAIYVFLAGDERTMSERSSLLIHFGKKEVSDGKTENYFKRLDQMEVDLIFDRIKGKRTKRTIKNWASTETYFFKDDAAKAGLTTENDNG